MPGEITQLLFEVRKGNPSAESELAALVYRDLHQMAAHYMQAERAGHSLQPTMLVHDAYLRLVSEEDLNWENRSHFFAMAARLMRRILIDHARTKRTAKRGAWQPNLPLDDVLLISDDKMDEVLMVDEALTRMGDRDPLLARIVEMRFFGGLTEDEIGEVVGISPRTVKRHWRVAKAWLHAELSSSTDTGSVADPV